MLDKIVRKINSLVKPSPSLRKKVISGSFWLYLLELFSKGLRVIQTIILARLLAPEYFGIIGIFFIVSGALESFSQTGFKKALIQRKNIDDNFLNTAWTVAIIRGFILFILIYLVSPLIVNFFNTPEALLVIRVLGLSLLIQGFYNVGIVYFLRNLEFHKEFFWRINGFLANFLISIPLAFILRNEWAIVWGLLGSNIVTLLFSFLLVSYIPKFKFDFKVFKVFFEYGKWLLFSAILIYLSRQGDKIIIAKLLDKVELGIYLIALRFARLPELFSKPTKNVLFPAYSKFQDNPIAIKKVYLKSLNVIALFCIPFVGGLVILAKPFISIFLGNRWISSVVPMQILTIACLINIITITGISLFNALGKTSSSFKVNVAWLLTLVIFIHPLITYYGIKGVALCYLIRALAGLVVWKREMSILLKIKIKNLSFFVFPVLNTMFFVSIIYYLNVISSISPLITFLSSICLSVIIYFSLGLIIHKFTKFKVLTELYETASIWKSDK